MKKGMRFFFILLTAVAGCILAYIMILAWVSWMTGYPWADMDWNSDGFTSLREILRSGDIGRREIQQEGKTCLEYFALKDASEVKVVCP